MLWMWRSSSLSSLRVLLALRARCDHVLTLLIKKRSTLHVLPILSARRGCPHSQPQSATVEGVGLKVAGACLQTPHSCNISHVQHSLPGGILSLH